MTIARLDAGLLLVLGTRHEMHPIFSQGECESNRVYMLGNEGQEEGWCRAACGACKAPEPLPHGLSGAWCVGSLLLFADVLLEGLAIGACGAGLQNSASGICRLHRLLALLPPELHSQIRMNRQWSEFSAAC